MNFVVFCLGVACTSVIVVFTLIIVSTLALRQAIRHRRRPRNGDGTEPLEIAFFHPYALAGGGGERVLWTALRALCDKLPHVHLVLYFAWPHGLSAEDAKAAAVRKAREAFGVDVNDVPFEPVDIARLVPLMEASSYPRFTLAFQAAGSALAGLLTFLRRPVDIVIDTANVPFALVAPKALLASTMAYVHYPTISADMIGVVERGEVAVNNAAHVAGMRGRAKAKLMYYRMFAAIYGAVGRWVVDEGVANSSWTADHLHAVWGRRVRVVFPPCVAKEAPCPEGKEEEEGEGEENGGADVSGKREEELAVSGKREEGLVVSVGQFRPEKRHNEQVLVMRWVAEEMMGSGNPRLVMVGGARDAEDRGRAAHIREEAERRGVPVEVRVDVSRAEMRKWLATAVVGLHTMRHEHFGISVVELMMAGVVVVAHRSGGVERDIVRHGENGFLAEGSEEFARIVTRVLRMGRTEREMITRRAKESCRRFSEEVFSSAFVDAVEGAVRRRRSR